MLGKMEKKVEKIKTPEKAAKKNEGNLIQTIFARRAAVTAHGKVYFKIIFEPNTDCANPPHNPLKFNYTALCKPPIELFANNACM